MTHHLAAARQRTLSQRVGRRRLLAAAALCLVACQADAQVTETVLYNFTGGSDGQYPEATLLADTAGPGGAPRALYGTAFAGGNKNANCLYFGCGTVFRLAPPPPGQANWTDTTLWAFTGGRDGSNPIYAGLFAEAAQMSRRIALYGTTEVGGRGDGVVFRLAGRHLTTPWKFTGGSDGDNPAFGQVVADSRGALYANAPGGGASGNGTVIKLTPPQAGQTAWTESTIWTFSGGLDGASPNGLVIDTAGALYGTASVGGAAGAGTVFKLTPPAPGQALWTEETLWSFQNGTDGAYPEAPLVAGRNGELFGTTNGGGVTPACAGCGTVFRLSPPTRGNNNWRESVVWSFSGGADGAHPIAAVILDRTGAVYGTATANDGAQNHGTAFRLASPRNGQTAWTETTLWAFTGGADGGFPSASLTPDRSGILYGTAAYGGSGTACYRNCGLAFSLTGTGFVPD